MPRVSLSGWSLPAPLDDRLLDFDVRTRRIDEPLVVDQLVERAFPVVMLPPARASFGQENKAEFDLPFGGTTQGRLKASKVSR